MSSFIAPPISRKKIREITTIIRREFGLIDQKYFPVIEFLEMGMHLIDEKFHCEYIEVEKMADSYAITYPEENKIEIREDVYLRATDGVPRDRFTIAHEIGHYILHGPNRVALARNDNLIKVPPYKDPEWQANTFAAEILAPPEIIKHLSLAEITEYCGVSKKVASIQLSHLN